VYIEGFTNGVRPVFGAGPVDALMNAMTLVRSFFGSFYGLDATPPPRDGGMD